MPRKEGDKQGHPDSTEEGCGQTEPLPPSFAFMHNIVEFVFLKLVSSINTNTKAPILRSADTP